VSLSRLSACLCGRRRDEPAPSLTIFGWPPGGVRRGFVGTLAP